MSGVEPLLKAMMLRSLDGDSTAYCGLLERLGGHLRAYYRRRLPNDAADTEDLVQEVLLALHLKRDTYDPKQAFTPWVYSLARYKLLDHLRRAGRRVTVPLDGVEVLFSEENPEEGAVRRDLDKLLACLPDRQRALMEDVKLAGLSTEEAAARSGMSADTARVNIHRSLQALMRKVRDENR